LFHTRGLSQAHAEELRRAVLDAARRVNAATNINERTRWQEELCKRLIQSEDYVSALHVANAIYQTEGADPERRAVHHFLMARIYRMMMDAALDPVAMEDARQLAIKTAQEVQRSRYPTGWGIGAAAAQLQKELSSRQTIAAAEFAASKRAQGGVDPRQAEAARAQTAAMEAAIYGRGGASRPSAVTSTFSTRPAGDLLADDTSRLPAATSEDGTGLNREEILSRLRQARAARSGSAIPGGVTPIPDNSSQQFTRSPVTATADDFPDFGASGGRQIGAPFLNGGTTIRGATTPGYSPRLPLSTEEREMLAPQRLNPTNSAVASALANRTGATMPARGYIPGGVNRPYDLGQGSRIVGAPAAAMLRQPANSRPMSSEASASNRSQSTQRRAGGEGSPQSQAAGSNSIRFSWVDGRRAPATGSGSSPSRLSGPVIIDSRSGRPTSARSYNTP
jgi:hypothetical protein